MFKPLLFALSLSMIVDVCGYKPAGKGKSLPADIKTIAVPIFQNSSLKYRVEGRFTSAVIEEILKRARALHVISNQENADAVINGDIRSFRATGSILDDQGRTRVWNVRIVVSIVVRDLRTHKILFQNPRMSFEVSTNFRTILSLSLTKRIRRSIGSRRISRKRSYRRLWKDCEPTPTPKKKRHRLRRAAPRYCGRPDLAAVSIRLRRTLSSRASAPSSLRHG